MSDKSATVDVDDTGLVGATVRIGQYEGTVISDKNGVVTIETTDLETGTTKLLEYDGISLREKSSTAEVTGNAVDGSAVSSLGVTNDELQAMTGKSVIGEVTGNAADQITSGYIAATNTALSMLSDKYVTGQVNGNAPVTGTAGIITGTRNAIAAMFSKSVTSQVNGNVPTYAAMNAIDDTTASQKLLPNKYVTSQVSGNVPGYAASNAIKDTTSAQRNLPNRHVSSQVSGSALTAASPIWNAVNAINSLQSRTVYVNVVQNVMKGASAALSAVQSMVGGHASGGFVLHADGGIVPRYHAPGGIATRAVPLDIVGEAGAEAIVPLTNRKYAMPFVGMIAEETSKAMRHRDMRVTNNTNVYINGAEIKAKSPRALDAIQVLFDEFGITEGMGVM